MISQSTFRAWNDEALNEMSQATHKSEMGMCIIS